MIENLEEILAFRIEKHRFAIKLNSIERIIRSLAITKLTDSPEFIEGVIDYYGDVIAVVNLRKRFGFSQAELKLSDRFIIIKTSDKKIALIVDEVENIILPDPQDLYNSKDIDAGIKFLNILRDDDGIILIYDIENLLNKSDEILLDKILEKNFPSEISI